MARERRISKKEESTKPTPESTEPTLFIGELSQVLGVGANSIKKAMKKGDRHFAEYCLERCGKKFKAVDVSKDGAKIPRWKFVEIQ